ncbi:MAG: methyl-accepting chemotaxis protein [Spirochaetaceae bacterium]|jgi:methyl-accepting chemotaxis protein|nr:methyl-accepting chemotaxis protein [Spirochaetaceae bacterium]
MDKNLSQERPRRRGSPPETGLAAETPKKAGGLLVKMVGLSSVCMLIAILVSDGMSIMNMRSLSTRTALVMGEKKLRGDMASFGFMLSQEYGQLQLENGQLAGGNNILLAERYTVVDRVFQTMDIAATIFVKEQNDFRRISTNIIDQSGKRAVNTFLGQDSAAFGSVSRGERYTGRAVILGRDYLTEYQPILDVNKNIIGLLFIGIEISAMEDYLTDHGAGYARNSMMAAAVILILSVIINALMCRRMVIRPIHEALGMLKDISEGEGDLTKRLTISGADEIGLMARYFNLTLEKIRNLVGIIKKQSLALADTGTSLAANMSETAGAVQRITSNIQSIKARVVSQSASVSQTHTTMEEVIVDITRLYEAVDRQSASVSRSSAGIEEMAATIQSVTKTLVGNAGNVADLLEAADAGRSGLKEVAEDMQEIAQESAGLLAINRVIKNIASKTNLLSMNAAIEAAHAGEAGKGFAVVADEIRKLAESSGEQSKTISQVLSKIKDSIDAIMKSIDTVLRKFEAIDAEVKTVSEQEETIRRSMEEQEAGNRQILEAIAELNTVTTRVKNGSDQIQSRSNEVIRESGELGGATQELSEGIGAIAAQVDTINAAVTRVHAISGENQQNIDLLIREVSRFRID